MAQNITSQITVVEGMTKEGIRAWINENLTVNSPCLIRTNFYSFFHCLLDNVESDSSILCGKDIPVSEETKELVKRNIVATKKKLEANMNFLLNSSIWVRFCDNGNWDGASDETKSNDIKLALEEFKWFDILHLYEFKAAQEYIEYQLRAQNQNYLVEIGGHGVHISPMIYSDEVEFRDFFLTQNNKLSFKYLLADPVKSKGFQTNDISLRILLVDDKISISKDASQCTRLRKCDNCDTCTEVNACKLRVIRALLSGEFIRDTTKRDAFKKKTYWADNVESFVVNNVGVPEIWEVDGTTNKLYLSNKGVTSTFENGVTKSFNGVQIIGVRDLETALSLMSFCKFDIILLDYLLGSRSQIDTTRTYSTELFEFLSYDFFKNEKSDVVEFVKDSFRTRYANVYPEIDNNKLNNLLKQFQDNVKLNRGPLDKFWIFPMTSYNSSFISDLQSKHVKLIDHRWNISQGADPINTPWKFLYKINEFVDLQLRQSVFWKNQLMTFIQFTGEDFEEQFEKEFSTPQEDESCFESFQRFMGAEYANLMKRYGTQDLIERDAAGDGGLSSSPFAGFISKSFYNDFINHGTEIELNRLMRIFYHHAATMFDDRYGRKHLRESFERLRVFIAYNNLDVLDTVPGNTETMNPKLILRRGLRFLNVVIDSDFNAKTIHDWLNLNKGK